MNTTNNYIKVYRRHLPSIELFFDSRNPTSVASAHRAAREVAGLLDEAAQAGADGAAFLAKATPKLVDPTTITVWVHGVRGLGDLHCVGGCEICSPRADLELVEAEDVVE